MSERSWYFITLYLAMPIYSALLGDLFWSTLANGPGEKYQSL